MSDEVKDIELKFDGAPIEQAGGAPADLVINSLFALQRLVHLIGMKSENRVFGQRIKPSARIRRDFNIICKAPEAGSHIQKFDVVSGFGQRTEYSQVAAVVLLRTLKAFDTGDIVNVEQVIPDERDRWFFADAAAGLLPPTDSGIRVTVRRGSAGPFSFSADRARDLVEKLRSGKPPRAGLKSIIGRLKAIDFNNSMITLQPSSGRAFRIWYPAAVEQMLHANARRRFIVIGIPEVNNAGDVTGFERIDRLVEAETPFADISVFELEKSRIVTSKPIRVSATYDFDDKLFIFQDKKLGIDVWSETYSKLRDEVIEALQMLWVDYALEDDDALDEDAQILKAALNERFKVI